MDAYLLRLQFFIFLLSFFSHILTNFVIKFLVYISLEYVPKGQFLGLWFSTFDVSETAFQKALQMRVPLRSERVLISNSTYILGCLQHLCSAQHLLAFDNY